MPYRFFVSPVCNSGLSKLCLHQCIYFIHQFLKVKSFLLCVKLSCFQLAHIQHIIYKFQKMACRKLYLMETVIYFFLILTVFVNDIKHPHNTVDRCADVMTHTVHKFRLGSVLGVCLLNCYFETFIFFLFFLMKLRRILKQNDSMNNSTFFICLWIIHDISGHQNCFLKPDRRFILTTFTIFNRHLPGAGFKSSEQFL